MGPNTPRFARATPSVASRVLSLPDGRQGQVRRLRLVPPLSLGLVAYSCIKGSATPIILTRSVLALWAALRCGLR